MRTPLRYLLNPCDVERLRWLAPIGDVFAALYDLFVGDVECTCCLGMRLALLVSVTAVAAASFTYVVTS